MLEINAPASAVWKALTDGAELKRWFPLEASSTPGKGGSIWISWGMPFDGECAIEIWEPERHLRTRWPWQADSAPVAPGEPVLVAVDYHLEARAGSTVLRIVHSGFGRDAAWDNELESVRHGWRYELQSLKRYLERHLGEDRRVVWLRRTFKGSRVKAWPRLLGPEGLGGHGGLGALSAGEPFALGAAGGDAVRGRVMVNEGPRQFFGTAENLKDGLVRLELEGPAIDSEDATHHLWLWLSVYGADGARLDRLEREWKSAVERVVPAIS